METRAEHESPAAAVQHLLDQMRSESGDAVYAEVLLRKSDGTTLVGRAGFTESEGR